MMFDRTRAGTSRPHAIAAVSDAAGAMAAHTAGHAETQLVIAGPSLQAGPASEQVARLESDGAEAAAGGVAITAAASMANSSLIKAQR